jgi:hypothetical protein
LGDEVLDAPGGGVCAVAAVVTRRLPNMPMEPARTERQISRREKPRNV